MYGRKPHIENRHIIDFLLMPTGGQCLKIISVIRHPKTGTLLLKKYSGLSTSIY